ncbi:unnamed protein product [Malus baccata var. baccata]
MQKVKSLGSNSISNSSGRLSTEENDDDEISRLAISAYQAKEEEIERKKMEVTEKVELQLDRAGEETRRLAQIWEELEVIGDPMRKELANVRKKIDMANRELKPLGLSCQKKKNEHHLICQQTGKIIQRSPGSFNEKNKEKAQLVTTLMELLTESEKLRMQKLEKLSKNIEPTL